jgi:predicted DCC family thiol-disulfide oxidoreductase YuxK
MNDHPVILFDGVCNFCNSTVNFTLKRNTRANIRFAPMQSEAGRHLLKHYNLPADDMQSFIFIEDGVVYKQSTAALRVCRHLKGVWPLCYSFIIVPKLIRDGIYNWIAGNRYKWFGKKDACMIPAPEVKARFLN